MLADGTQADRDTHFPACTRSSTLGTTPTVATGLAEESYDCAWIVGLIHKATPPPKKPEPAVGIKYRPRKTWRQRLRPEKR